VTAAGDPRTWRQLAGIAVGWSEGGRATLRLVEQVRPDVVHLNSVVLSASAAALHAAGVPYVWHIREHPPSRGVRTLILQRLLERAGDRVVFISHADRLAWGVKPEGRVIHNFVEPHAFDTIDRADARAAFGIPTDVPVILYVGGLSMIKGILPLLESLRAVVGAVPDVRVLMPSAVYDPPATAVSRIVRRAWPLVGGGTIGQRAMRLLSTPDLDRVCIRVPYQQSLRLAYAAADLLLFPAVRPHFARPVIEAAAAGVPAIASRLSGIEELVDDGATGILVEPGDPASLAAATVKTLRSPVALRRLGEAARARARERFDARQGVSRIMALYDSVLADSTSASRAYAQAV
jgi:glycosyltransferase involved in cell wall biosynthesis